jgi:hypothetical protein
MKFGPNQPRLQPVGRGAHPRSHSRCVYPANRSLQGPLSPSLTVPPRASNQEREDDNELDVSAHISVKACEGGMPEVFIVRDSAE